MDSFFYFSQTININLTFPIYHFIGGNIMKKTVCFVLSAILLLTFSGCTFFSIGYLEIESGFSRKLVSLLSERYELNIPDSAVFIDGRFDRAFQDPSVTVCFTVDAAELESMFAGNWEEDKSHKQVGLFINDYSFEPDGGYEYQKERYTCLLYTDNGDGTLTCYFTGRHPGRSFR